MVSPAWGTNAQEVIVSIEASLWHVKFLSNSRTALIVGTTGLIGGHCLTALLNDPAYSKVISVTRRELKVSHAKLISVCADFDQISALSHRAEFQNSEIDDVFCCLGTTIKAAGSKEAFYKVDYTYSLEFAKLAHHLHAKRFLVVSSLGADRSSKIFYSKVKGELEQALRGVGFESLKIFQPSLLLGERAQVRMGETIAQKVLPPLSFLFLGPLKKYAAIRATDVARAMLTIAKRDTSGIEVFQSDQIQDLVSVLS